MTISLKEYFLALASLLDFLEVELHNRPTNHCKRVSLFALRAGKLLNLPEEELVTLGALSLLHDLGASHANIIVRMEQLRHPDVEVFPDHCKAGADLIGRMTFLSQHSEAILCHHERYDGKGFYKRKDDIPLYARIITLSDRLDMERTNLGRTTKEAREMLVRERGRTFSPEMADLGEAVLGDCTFDETFSDGEIDRVIGECFPEKTVDASDGEVRSMTGAFSIIVDAKSPFTKNHSTDLAGKTEVMCRHYGMDDTRTGRMVIAANLHDIGKLSVPNRILDKDGKLTSEEFAVIKQHTYYTRQALSRIGGWEDITDWASDHHEKLNGRGYPIGKGAEGMPFESRLMACLDIYQALSEDRPYKSGFSNEKSFAILDKCVEANEIDGDIVEDLRRVFYPR